MSEQLSALAYRNFVETCRTVATRRIYVKALHYYMDYLHLAPEAYDRLLDQDPKITQMNICDYVSFLRKQKAPATVSAYVAAVRKFYSMNDIQLNWNKIHNFEGEKEKQAEDRPYTHSEIQTSFRRLPHVIGLLFCLWPLVVYVLVLFLFLESETWSL